MFRITFTKHKDLSLEVYSWLPEKKDTQVALVPKSPINFSSHTTGLVCATSLQCLFMSFYLSISHTKFITSKVFNSTIFKKTWLRVVLFPLMSYTWPQFWYKTCMISRGLLMLSDWNEKCHYYFSPFSVREETQKCKPAKLLSYS